MDGRGALKGSVPVTTRPQEAALVSGCGWWWSGRRGGSNSASTSAMCVRALMSFVKKKPSLLVLGKEPVRPLPPLVLSRACPD